MPIPVYFWLVPVFAMVGLFLHRKNKHILFFGLVSFLGILLTKQVGLPFSGLYEWMYLHFPGFSAYREASKFFFIVALGYSVLIAGFIDWLFINFQKEKRQSYIVYGVTLLVAILFLWNAKPAITGELGTLFVPRHIPEDYIVLKNNIIKQPEFFRTLWVPVYSRWSIYTNNHPELSAIDQINGAGGMLITNEAKDEKNVEGDLVIKLLQKPVGNTLLDTASIKYVFVPLQDDANDDNFFKYYGKDRSFYITSLDSIPYLKRVNIGLKNIAVYENEGFKPHISLTNISPDNGDSISSQFINPSEYKVLLSHVMNPITLHFSESYHPKWKLHVGEFEWIKTVTDKNYFLTDRDHTKDTYGLNSYYLDPRAICQNYDCKKNPDGSYDIEMTLFFQPQAYGYIGSIISAITFISSVIFLIVSFVKVRLYGKK